MTKDTSTLDKVLDDLVAGEEPDTSPVRLAHEDEALLLIARQLLTLSPEAWPELGSDGATTMDRERLRRGRRRISIGRTLLPVAAAAAVTTALIVVAPWSTTGGASAAVVASRAVRALASGSLPAVHLEEVATDEEQSVPEPVPPRIVDVLDYAAADQWRERVVSTLPHDEGTRTVVTVRRGTAVGVDDGASVRRTTTSNDSVASGAPVLAARGAVLDELTAVAGGGQCAPHSSVENGPAVFGRATEVLRLGPSPCPSADIPESNGPADITIDQETSLVLRAVLYDASGWVAAEITVTAFEPQPTFAPDTFALPAPKPSGVPASATGSDSPSNVAELAAESAYTPLMPTDVDGLRVGAITVVRRDVAGRADEFSITYEDAYGTPQFQLYEAPTSSPSVRYPGRAIGLSSGATATYDAPNADFRVLWFTEGDIYLSITGAGQPSPGVVLGGALTESELEAIAGSVK